MKLCVFADIHGNKLAFDKAYPMILDEQADRNIFLGDLCGYYFDETLILKRLKEMPRLIALKGNHDQMFLEAALGNDPLKEMYSRKYGPSLDHFLKKPDRSALLDWMSHCSGSYVHPEGLFSCYHGSPGDPLNGYIYPDSDLKVFEDCGSSYIFLGATHYPMIKKLKSTMIVNPGSLGQPRQGAWPTYAVVDTQTHNVALKEVQYNKEEFIKHIGPFCHQHPYLTDVILREKNV